MTRLLSIVVALLAVGFAINANGQTGTGWTQVFDGKTLDGWTQLGTANWRVEDGVIVADKVKTKGNAHLVSKQSYKDFQIYAEFWVSDDANSGIFIRCKDPTKVGSKVCYEVNIYDQRPEPKYGTGAIVDVAAVDPMPRAGGRWNTYEITAKGPHMVVVLNGKQTVDVKNDLHAEGHFTLQYGAGTVKFRKVAVKAL